MNIFKKPKFGPRPPNYVPGIGRGAVPFFTRSDIGSADSLAK
jgi:PRP1 splicing factor, N-terminal